MCNDTKRCMYTEMNSSMKNNDMEVRTRWGSGKCVKKIIKVNDRKE